MLNTFKSKKQIAIALIIAMCIQVALPGIAFALSEGPSQPEAMQFEPVDATDLVNLPTGDFSYSLPLFEIPGPEGNYPLNLSYHAGIGVNQEPTWVGLGWSLNPGSINRAINGYPDDFMGANVQTHYEGERSGWGVDLTLGYGPAGINMSYDSYNGFGVNGFSIGIGGNGPGFNLFIGGQGVSTGIGYSHHLGSVFMGNIGISAAGREIGISAGISYCYSFEGSPEVHSHPAIGLSLGSSGNNNFSPAGVGFASSSQPGNGEYSSNSFQIPIITPSPFWGSIGYQSWSWRLNETYDESSFGYLHQSSYHTSQSETKKYERQLSGDYLFSSQDIYHANAQGISGTFMPFMKEAYLLVDMTANIEKAKLKYEDNYFGPYTEENEFNFRFLGDQGGNFITKDEATHNPNGWGLNYYNIFDGNQKRYSSKIIEPIINASSGKLNGFRVIDIDGKIYEYIQPVNNHVLYSYSSSNAIEYYSNLATPYANNWLLTAIKGPDYIDQNADTEVNEGDFGYWVKFSYVTTGKQLWRAPYSGTTPGTASIYDHSYSAGVREEVYLESIETPSHKAIFNTSILKNRNVPPEVQGLETRCKSTDYNIHQVNGNFIEEIRRVNDPETILFTIASGYFGELVQRTGTIKKGDIIDNSLTYDPLTNTTSFTENATPQNYNGPWVKNYLVKFQLGSLLSVNYQPVAKRLDSISLYKKISENNDPCTKSIVFHYDYSLCPGIPNFSDIESDSSDIESGGKSTLKSIDFCDGEKNPALPPYLFEYSLNPQYHEYDWDRWGSYRDPLNGLDRGYNKHMTPQDKFRADKASAWSLTKIHTPTGTEIGITYEADDYYTTERMIDLVHSQNRCLSLNNSGNSFTLTYPGDIPEELKVDTKFYLFTYKEESTELTEHTIVAIEGDIITFLPSYDFGTLFDPHYTYIIFSAPKIHGGGIRVKSIKTGSLNDMYITNYNYKSEDGTSSGVATSLPAQYKNYSVLDVPLNNAHPDGNVVDNYNQLYLQNDISYGRPAPRVIYSRVEIQNVDQNDNPLNGKTVYNYYTPKDYGYSVSIFNNLLVISDYSGIYMKPKSVEYFEQYENNGIEYRKVKEDLYSYSFGSGLYFESNVVKLNDDFTQSIIQTNDFPLGTTTEKYKFKNYPAGKELFVDKNFSNIYLIGTEAKQLFYDSPTSNTPAYTLTTKYKYFMWDALSGSPIAVATVDSRNKISVNKTIPAYWKYADFKCNNLLTQVFQKTTYNSEYDINSNLKNYAFPSTDVVESKITTWSNAMNAPGGITSWNNGWKVNDTYVYDRTYSYIEFPSDKLNYMDDIYPVSNASFPWQMTSNITAYDCWSRPVEEYKIDNSYSTVLYGTDETNGYAESLPIAIIFNASQKEVGYIGFERNRDDWETGNWITSDDFAHTGIFSAFSNNNDGPSKTFYCKNDQNARGIDKNKEYVFEGWIKIVSGTANLKIEGFNGTENVFNKVNSKSTGTGWQHIKLILTKADMSNLPETGKIIVKCSFNGVGNSGYIDDLRFHPKDADMSTYTYDPILSKVTSITDRNNITTYYDYYPSGRLKMVKNQDGNIVQHHDYNFKSIN